MTNEQMSQKVRGAISKKHEKAHMKFQGVKSAALKNKKESHGDMGRALNFKRKKGEVRY